MTKISLRVYNHEIEAMVESGQVDEAIAHCQNILKTFPMHLETYRLLGKAFLETRRYVDATDIFQRVLMSVPEDFVSHVGMSIIKDDENKLDEAIWHMERAFEVQPSNPAIQDELRKLYGRRDGVQPPKVRLTRDALANMYTQGALYSQAIAEIRAVLADDPNRPDLLVMLARAYSKDGRKKQAIEICTELLKKYPYCFDALRILIDLLPPSDQHDITQTYRLRVMALDPYAGFVTGSIFNSDSVPDVAVNLELLNYDPNKVESEPQPAWASSLGISLEPDKEKESVQDWLSEKKDEINPISEDEKLSLDTQIEEQPSSVIEDVPDWMRSSGWKKPSEQTSEGTVFDDAEQDNDELIVKAEIPEWLKNMAPEEESADAGKLPDGFESMLDEIPMNTSIIDENVNNINIESGLVAESIKNDIPEEGIPDWINEIVDLGPIQEESTSIKTPQVIEPEQDVFSDFSSENKDEIKDKQGEQPVDDISSWLDEINQESIESGDDAVEKRDGEEDLPDWLKGIGTETRSNGLEIKNEPANEVPNLLEELSFTQDKSKSTLEANTEEEIPDWLKEIRSPQEDRSIIDELTATLVVGSAIPPASEGEKDTQNHELIPEDDGLDYKEEVNTMINEEIPLKKDQIEVGSPSMDEQYGALAWLDGLAARQGSKSEELLTKPEDRLEEPPEWVKNSIADEIISSEDEKLILLPANPDTMVNINSDEIKTIYGEEFESINFPDNNQDNQIIKSDEQEKLDESWIPASNILGAFPEESIQEEPRQSEGNAIPKSDYEPFSLINDLLLEEGLKDEQKKDLDNIDSLEQEIASSPGSDVSKWLVELDANDTHAVYESTSTKVEEFYGDEKIEPLPDWLKEIEKGSISPEWISESDELSEISKGIDQNDLIPDVKDLDDIGEIFPADITNWTIEELDHEPDLEPLNEEVKPITSGEWQTIRSEKEPVKENIEISKVGFAPTNNESSHNQKPPGIGMLSNIPDNDIEKEAGTLERAKSYIESGDLKKAVDAYGRLIKKGQLIERVIHDLRETTSRYPFEIEVWQLLGDACMKANRLQDALDAYTKAEELLR